VEESWLITLFSAFRKITNFFIRQLSAGVGWRPCLSLHPLLHLFRVSGEFIYCLLTFFLANLDLHSVIQHHLDISQQGRDLLEVLFERRNSSISYPFSANLGPHEDDFLT